MENNNKRDLFQAGTSTKPGNYQQDDMMRSSGDNDADRIAPDDSQAREATNQAYFEKTGENAQQNADRQTSSDSKDGLVERDESLKNSK